MHMHMHHHHHHQHGHHGQFPPQNFPGGMAPQLATKTQSHFFKWAKDTQLVHEEPLSKLNKLHPQDNTSPVVIGVDGGHLLSLLQAHVGTNEPFYYLSSPIPYGASKFLDDFLKSFADNGLRPVIVFDGMPIEPAVDFQTVPRINVEWAKVVDLTSPECPMPPIKGGRTSPLPPNTNSRPNYTANMSPQEVDSLKKRAELCNLQWDEDFTAWVIRYLVAKNVEVLRAPYWAWPQLAAFLHKSNRLISDVYGPCEMLIFDHVERLITEIDFEQGKFHYLSKSECVEKASTKDLDLLLMLDSAHKYFATFCLPTRRPASFQDLLRESHNEPDLKNYVLNMPRLQNLYMAVKQSFVCHHNGEMVQLWKIGTLCKNDNSSLFGANHVRLSTFFGTRLPQCFYFFLHSNVISPHTLTAVVSGRISDPPMLLETKEGKIAIERVLPLRTQIVFQIVQQLANPDHNNTWFQSDFALTWIRHASPVPILRPPQIKLDEWQNIRADEFATFGTVLDYAMNATSTATYTNVRQALAAVHLKSLDLLGYFTHATHSNSAEVSGKSVYSEALTYCNGCSTDYAVLLIEMLRTRSLTDQEISTLQKPSEEKMAPGARFFTRMVSLLPVELQSPYTGPVHCGLLAFNAIAKHLHRTLRSLTEVVSLTLFLEGHVSFPLHDYAQFPNELPFKQPPGVIAGVMAHFLLNGPAKESLHKEWTELSSPGRRYEYVQAAFPDIKDIKQVIFDIFAFWDSGVLMLMQLSRDDTPTVDSSITKMAMEFHNKTVVPLAAKYDITLELREEQPEPLPTQQP